ncbi:MAG TPA: hypothetical protein VF548_12960 [Allosphingosinicella sp.]|jgi:hypothetical protein
MQKPPEFRRPALLLDRRVLDEDGGDDQELTGKGDDARHSGFHDTHFNFLLSESDPAPATLMASCPLNLNCKGRHNQMHFLQLLLLGFV